MPLHNPRVTLDADPNVNELLGCWEAAEVFWEKTSEPKLCWAPVLPGRLANPSGVQKGRKQDKRLAAEPGSLRADLFNGRNPGICQRRRSEIN